MFNTRLQLSEILREPEHNEHIGFRNELLDILYKEVSSFDRDSFIVRRSLRYVDQFKSRDQWENLSKTDIIDIKQHLTPLILTDQEDELAKRFDLIILNLQIAHLTGSMNMEPYIKRIKHIGRGLLKKSNIPMVQQHMDTIKSIVTDEYWQQISLGAMETVRLEIRELIRFLDREEQTLTFTDLTDEINEPVREWDLIKSSTFTEGYLMRVEKYVREHQDLMAIMKLKYNMPITAQELEELEKILFDGETRAQKKTS
ncbi:MAG: hypothetical protein U5Q03_00105 [Bacteroidota bacterium]|nr:hypothetical protein [Bacteroidota bacterium]